MSAASFLRVGIGASGTKALLREFLTPAGGGGVAVSGTALVVLPSVAVTGSVFIPNLDTWDESEREWDRADAVYSESRPVMIVGTEFFQADQGVNFGGEGIQVVLGRTGLTIVGRDRLGQWEINPTVIKFVTGIWPLIKAEAGTIIGISLGSQENADDPVVWQGPRLFRVGEDSFLDFTVAGRYIAVRFESEGQLPWELLAYDLEVEVVGERYS
jgi:hypothetical protein